PSSATVCYHGSTEFFLKLIEAAERGFDVIGEFTFRFAASVRPHDLPKERVIGVAAAIVAHDCANVFRNSIDVTDKVLYGFLLEIGALHCLVQVIDISLMMFR